MIVLHHLNQSRSIRILWLLEEIGVPYRVVPYRRRADNSLAPETLRAIHPLGKSPVVEVDGHVLAESGAIAEWLIMRYAPHLAPNVDSLDYADYLQWMYFAESSVMVPLLLQLFAGKESADMMFLPGYAQAETDKVLGYLNEYLTDRRYLVTDKLTGADFMMSFVVDVLANNGRLAQYAHIERYARQLAGHASWQRAQALEMQYNT